MLKPAEDFDIRILFAEDEGYSDLIAEVYYRDEFICLVSQDKGIDNLEIEFHSVQIKQVHKFGLSEFEQTLYYVRNRLKELS